MTTLKVLSALISYPTVELTRRRANCAACSRRKQYCRNRSALILKHYRRHCRSRPTRCAGTLFLLFDRTPLLSLHLFEHVHGESRDRGQAWST